MNRTPRTAKTSWTAKSAREEGETKSKNRYKKSGLTGETANASTTEDQAAGLLSHH